MNDALAPIATSGTFVEPITKSSIRIPALPSLAYPATDLGGRLGPAYRALALHGKSQSLRRRPLQPVPP